MSDSIDRPCHQYFIQTFGDGLEQAWVPLKATHTFEGGYQFENLPVLRRRGRQKDENYRYSVTNCAAVPPSSWAKTLALLART